MSEPRSDPPTRNPETWPHDEPDEETRDPDEEPSPADAEYRETGRGRRD